MDTLPASEPSPYYAYMRRRWEPPAIATLLLLLLPAPASAAAHSDPNDVTGRFDVKRLKATRDGYVEIRVQMYGKLSKKLFASGTGDKVVVLFDADDDGSTDYKGRIRKDGKDLYIAIEGSGSAFEPLEVRFTAGRRGLAFTVPGDSPPAPDTAFGLAVKTVFDGAKDRAPDAGWLAVPASPDA